MLGMLRRARERREEEERNCLCNKTCPCHKPEPELPSWALHAMLLFFGVVVWSASFLVPPSSPKQATLPSHCEQRLEKEREDSKYRMRVLDQYINELSDGTELKKRLDEIGELRGKLHQADGFIELMVKLHGPPKGHPVPPHQYQLEGIPD